MSSVRFQHSDFVSPADRADYERAVAGRVDWLRKQPGLVSVYSIGSVGHPGISDIDLVAVFDDNARVHEHPLTGLDPMARYLFVHTLYGAGKSDFLRAQRYSFYQNYHLLHGESLLDQAVAPEPAHRATIERQIAFEFMLRMYISLTLQREYRLLRLRTLLLHGKGLLHDARTMGLTGARFFPMLEELMGLRDRWFAQAGRVSNRALEDWFMRFEPAYVSFLEAYLADTRFEVPAPAGFRYAKNIRVEKADRLQAVRSGFRVPLGNALLGRKYFNLLNRFNAFKVGVPYSDVLHDPVVAGYYTFASDLRKRTRDQLPGFFALTSAFQVD